MQCPSFKTFLVISLILPLSTAIPSSLSACSRSPECLRKSLQAALPSFIDGSVRLGLPSLDPFFIDKLELVLPGDLKIEFRQGFSKGLKKCKIDSAVFIDDVLKAQVHCDFFIKGKYKSTGKLLMFSINGDGDAVVMCRQIKIQGAVKLATIMNENGEEYLNITQVKTNHTFDGRVSYKLTNLIKNSPQLSNAIVQFMNTNWRMIAEEFGKPIVDFGVNTVLTNMRKLFRTVPLNKLYTSGIFVMK